MGVAMQMKRKTSYYLMGFLWLEIFLCFIVELINFGSLQVSLAASRIRSSRTFPLASFLDELTEHFKVELMDETTSKVGDYFALATVFPSSEVCWIITSAFIFYLKRTGIISIGRMFWHIFFLVERVVFLMDILIDLTREITVYC